MFILAKVKTNQDSDSIVQILNDDSINFLHLHNLKGSIKNDIIVLQITIKDSPENNKANNKIIKLLAKFFHTQQNKIEIIKGHTAKIKLIKINASF